MRVMVHPRPPKGFRGAGFIPVCRAARAAGLTCFFTLIMHLTSAQSCKRSR